MQSPSGGPSSEDPTAPAPHGAREAAPAAPKRRILVVDDNLDAAETLSEYLADVGHTVGLAHDGPSAVTSARELLPDLVLLDVGLPGLDGYAVARELRRTPALQGTILVAVTGYGEERDRERALAAGFDLHMVKPMDLDALDRLLATLPTPPAGRRSSSTEQG